ncbi:hypothetical protein KBB96_10525 [Luteolibacter ambystomatis]|uniref:Uncharacterized protein n=1 Tax=Luteolibacter ambystomatis TaxID=2824561 RepID=A0A975IXG9_9BACT|nr:hypothetical protein [Luteolibacter ambystomatis]QUE49306.1 hypothetical protein KBB96_10525 [Luteolibacter ambystomatis]
MISQEDPRLRHARALFALALFILVAGQFLPVSPSLHPAGWTRWTGMGRHFTDVLRGHGDQKQLLVDGLLLTSSALVLLAPFFTMVLARSAPLLWTARLLTLGTWVAWLSIKAASGGEAGILIALIILTAGLIRLPAPAHVPRPAR